MCRVAYVLVRACGRGREFVCICVSERAIVSVCKRACVRVYVCLRVNV